ncbi:viperin family antiviral radical SAM protein [Polyangium mundeleinium]|uniref:S-adenosylmethionine-dependent nucleotide dehydratase n=1 Tax=Polyangium mundeleinium TaxID=2995306 RepID=A0ABT5EGB3_9BACT|nr:viperin family antiviral radical SAM protein [Polyangium mundeleinium]MDC0740865.1 viperin family antiviral radical SAM protein [Polyangium mundeleinium]
MTRAENWKNAGPGGLPVPLNVSWHLWPDCDLACTYCYATFRDIPRTLSKKEAIRVLDLFREAGTEKVTFVGGEPLLCPHIEELIAHAKSIGLVTMLVTNGTRLAKEQLLHRIVPLLDWVSLSIDGSTPELMAEMGRGNAAFWKHCIRCWKKLSEYPHLRLKINTVVTRQNVHDDMRALIRELRPARWKVFQVLPVKGQNDGKVEPLLIKREEFDTYVARHRELDAEGLGPVAEDNRALTGTYLMLDALGRLFSNKTGEHVYTESVLDVGVWEVVRQVGWDVEGFLERGGIYGWKHDAIRPAAEALVPLRRRGPG